MRLAFPPVFILALLVALIGTQAAYLGTPGRPNYLARLGLSVVAVGVGEALAALGVGGRLAVGDLHLVNDLVLLGLAQWGATRWARRQTPV
ncbi:MAG TPA: hypothetical protein VET82_07610 [Candidatus Eisenbacteria bacterium]|nr:hypothetical protein [Candidatus Eisenbacteria bacterium]